MTFREISVDEAMELAKFQRPGCEIIVGPDCAREIFGRSLHEMPIHVLNRLATSK